MRNPKRALSLALASVMLLGMMVVGTSAASCPAINDTERAGTSASMISGYTVELGKHLYNGKLKLNNNDQDVFGRPARTWEYDDKAIGSYAKEELLDKEYVGKVTGKDLYDLLGNTILGQNNDYDVYYYIDGVETKTPVPRHRWTKPTSTPWT